MRDAFGGTFMIQVFLVFILIYICFTAMALNYAKAFKVKNAVIEYLESSEITNLEELDVKRMEEIETYLNETVLRDMNYNLSQHDLCRTGSGSSTSVLLKNPEGKIYAYCNNLGIMISQSGKGINTEGVYYTVSTYIGWSMPFLNNLLALNGNNKKQDVPVGMWTISGQTRLIVNQ